MRKKQLPILILALLLAGLTVGCGVGGGTTPPTSPIRTTTPATTPPVDNAFTVFSDGTYRAALVTPTSPTSLEKNTVARIQAALLLRTGVQIPTLTYAEAMDAPYEKLILIGETGHPASSALYEELSERSAAARIKDGTLAVGFVHKESADVVIGALVDALLASSETVSLPLGFQLSHQSLPTLSELPAYSEKTEQVTLSSKSVMRVGASSADAFSAYKAAIEAAGFVPLAEREAKGNLFATYRNEKEYIYLYYTAYAKEIRIITGPLAELVETSYKSEAKASVSPSIASIPQPDNGQGYIIRLADGRFLVHDGGYGGDDRVYATLRQLQPEGEIVIAAYFLSHPHGDHHAAFGDFVKTHGNSGEVALERVILNYGDPARYDIDGTAGVETYSDDVEWVFNTMRSYCPGIPVLRAHTGQVIDFGSGATVEILYTVEDLFPTELPNINDSSLVMRVNVAGTSVMLLADTCYASGPILADLWGDHLRSDVMQIAHHGQWPSVEEIYHLIQGEIVLYPSVLRRLSVDLLDSRWDEQCAAVFKYAKDLYVSGDALEILPLPYTVKNNKQEMIDKITGYKP